MEELGLKSSPDVAELAAKEVADSYNLTRQKNLLKISIIRLKEKMYFPIDEDLQIAGYDSLEAVAKTEDSPLDIYRHALLFLPTAQAAEALCCTGNFLIGKAKGALFPHLWLRVGYQPDSRVLWTVVNIFLFRNSSGINAGYYVGFSLSFPIFDGLARISNVKRGKRELIIARNEKEEAQRTLYSEIEQAVADMNGRPMSFIRPSGRKRPCR